MKNNRVDHPRKSSKDLADAVCGAIFGAISHTPRDNSQEIEIHTFRDRPRAQLDSRPDNVIEYKPMPKDVQEYLQGFDLI